MKVVFQVRGNCENTPERREAYRGYMAMCTSLDNAFDHRYEEVRTFRVHRISGVAALVGSAGSPSPDEQPSPG